MYFVVEEVVIRVVEKVEDLFDLRVREVVYEGCCGGDGRV